MVFQTPYHPLNILHQITVVSATHPVVDHQTDMIPWAPQLVLALSQSLFAMVQALPSRRNHEVSGASYVQARTPLTDHGNAMLLPSLQGVSATSSELHRRLPTTLGDTTTAATTTATVGTGVQDAPLRPIPVVTGNIGAHCAETHCIMPRAALQSDLPPISRILLPGGILSLFYLAPILLLFYHLAYIIH